MYSINPEAPSAGPGPLITYTSKPVLVSKQVYTCTFTLRPHTSLSGPHTCKYGHHGHHPRWGEIFFFLLPPTNNIMLFRLHFLYEQVFFEHLPSGNELDRKHTSVKNKVSFFKNQTFWGSWRAQRQTDIIPDSTLCVDTDLCIKCY